MSRRFPSPQVFVSTTYFSENRSLLPSFLFVDCRYSLGDPIHYGPKQHQLSRPVGSVLAEIESPAFCGNTHGITARHPLPETRTFIQWCQAHGLSTKPLRRVPVCFDDQGSGLAASRVWWMLQNLGLEAYILDGGFQQYKAAGLPLITSPQANDVTKTATTAVPADASSWPYATEWSHVAHEADVMNPDVHVVDARAADRYSSSLRPSGLDVIAGHLPNSVNHPWPSNVQPAAAAPSTSAPSPPVSHNVLKPIDALRAQMLQSYGSHTARDAVFMCASGVTACINVAVSAHVGLGTPRLFVEGWSGLCGTHRKPLLDRALATANGNVTAEVLSPQLSAPSYDPRVDAIEVNGRRLAPPVDLDRLPAAVRRVVKLLKVGEETIVYEQHDANETITFKVKLVRTAHDAKL